MQVEKTEIKENNAEFAFRIKGLTNKANLTQGEISSRLNISPARVGNWFHGRNKPKSPIKEKLAELLDVSPSYLVDGIPDPSWQDRKDRIYRQARLEQTTVKESSPLFPDRTLNINPEFRPPRPVSSNLDKIDAHLLPWREAAAESPDVSSIVMGKLVQHFKPEELRELHKAFIEGT
jgi:transcriptional regulator with XRE-family HTH domain